MTPISESRPGPSARLARANQQDSNSLGGSTGRALAPWQWAAWQPEAGGASGTGAPGRASRQQTGPERGWDRKAPLPGRGRRVADSGASFRRRLRRGRGARRSRPGRRRHRLRRRVGADGDGGRGDDSDAGGGGGWEDSFGMPSAILWPDAAGPGRAGGDDDSRNAWDSDTNSDNSDETGPAKLRSRGGGCRPGRLGTAGVGGGGGEAGLVCGDGRVVHSERPPHCSGGGGGRGIMIAAGSHTVVVVVAAAAAAAAKAAAAAAGAAGVVPVGGPRFAVFRCEQKCCIHSGPKRCGQNRGRAWGW